jgi:hypothetical protein
VAGLLTRGAFLRSWRLRATGGLELDVPDTPLTLPRSGTPAGGPAGVPEGAGGDDPGSVARTRRWTRGRPCRREGQRERALARRMYQRLGRGWLLIAGCGFYNWPDWEAAAQDGRCCGG